MTDLLPERIETGQRMRDSRAGTGLGGSLPFTHDDRQRLDARANS
jgi:hypothetical protein